MIYRGKRLDYALFMRLCRSWGHNGQTPVIPETKQRFGCYLISAINNKGHLNFIIFKSRFDINIFLGFVKREVRQNKRNHTNIRTFQSLLCDKIVLKSMIFL